VRAWALAHPQEFALVYGSPVVGYAAPVDTVEPATRIARVLAAVTADAVRDGALEPSAHPLPGPRLLEPGVVELAGGIPDAPFEDVIERSLTMWIGHGGGSRGRRPDRAPRRWTRAAEAAGAAAGQPSALTRLAAAISKYSRIRPRTASRSSSSNGASGSVASTAASMAASQWSRSVSPMVKGT